MLLAAAVIHTELQSICHMFRGSPSMVSCYQTSTPQWRIKSRYKANVRQRGMLMLVMSKTLSGQSLLDVPEDSSWLIGIARLSSNNYQLSGQFYGATW